MGDGRFTIATTNADTDAASHHRHGNQQAKRLLQTGCVRADGPDRHHGRGSETTRGQQQPNRCHVMFTAGNHKEEASERLTGSREQVRELINSVWLPLHEGGDADVIQLRVQEVSVFGYFIVHKLY